MRTISTTDLAHRLRPVVTRLARRMRQEAAAELSPTQGAALATIDCHGPLTPSELAARERIQRPTATRVLARLEEAGLVARTPDPADRRSSLVSTTPAGHELLRRGARPQRRLSRSAAGPPEPRGPRRARPRRRNPRAHARGGTASDRRGRSPRSAFPNYRRYFSGQVISITGNWMQIVGEMWLMVKLTGSGVSVGLTAGLQFLPILLFGAWGGLLADRMSKRTLLTITQLSMTVPALTLFGLTLSGAGRAVDGAGAGAASAARCWRWTTRRGSRSWSRSSGPDRVLNAVALNSVVVHCARILGPAAAGIAIALFGISWCFVAERAVVPGDVRRAAGDGPDAAADAEAGSRAGAATSRPRCATCARTPELLIPLAMMALVGTISFNFQVLLPLLADFTWNGTAATYAALTAAMGVGSVAGALVAGARGRVSPRLLVVVVVWPSASRCCWPRPRRRCELQIAALVPLGAASVTFAAGVNSRAADRGRADHARARDGAVLDRLPRLDADRRAARRLARGGRGAARRPARAGACRRALSLRPRCRARGSRRVEYRRVAMAASPLETVARNHGAVMASRHGRRVPAHFGSTAAEEAVCLRGVGMADRSDRETFELRGTPEAIEQALVRARGSRLGLVHRPRPRGGPLRGRGGGGLRRRSARASRRDSRMTDAGRTPRSA